MDRESTAHLVLGLAAAGERQTRAVASVARRPAAIVWRSRLAGPLRTRSDAAARSLEHDGRRLAEEMRERASPLLERLMARVADEQLVERALAELLAQGTVARVAEQLVNAGVAGDVVAGDLVDQVTERFLASDEMRRVLGFVMASPELRAALATQSSGLAEDVAAGVRARTASGDAAVERVARLLSRRRPR